MNPVCPSDNRLLTAAAASFALWGSAAISAQDEALVTLPDLYVTSSHTAIVEPASTYGAPVSRLELNPQIDLQVRNLAEAQGDVTIRGGIFENTGFRVGAATLIDPQTGHYFAEIPIAPEMLRGPEVLTGVDNALGGFNSTVGTIDYGWVEIADGGSALVGWGDHNLNFQRLRHGQTFASGGPASWGVEFEISRSESAGTIENGDHDFVRYGARTQRVTKASQTDFFAGYQAKYLAWPELYAAPYGSNESDSVRTLLLMANHAQRYGDGSSWEATVYHRNHHDHYLFNRFSDSRAFLHETEVTSGAVAGSHRFSDRFALAYSGQATADSIESSTLENNFTSRSYLKLAALPTFTLSEQGEDSWVLRAGASYDDSNRDPSKVSPMVDLTYNRADDSYYLSYAQSSQVSGYTAIGGSTGGLFASNPNLSREVTRNFEVGATVRRNEWSLRAAAFAREDADLVDWTFSRGGLIRGDRIINRLRDMVGDVDIESLDLDFTAVAVDIEQGREIWISHGSLFEAIRSSIAIPGLFTPHRHLGRLLVDGGITASL